MDFFKKIKPLWDQQKFVCVGLDPDVQKIPSIIKKNHLSIKDQILQFNIDIIDQTWDLVCCYKPNAAFYEAHGTEGWEALLDVCDYIKFTYPKVPIILDAKRADIDSTNEGYTKAFFENLNVDAVTLHPYLGQQALETFLKIKEKMFFILVKTSNKGSDEFQNLKIGKKFLFEIVAENVANDWNKNKNCGVVVGATYPEELKSVRKIIGDIPILIPGVGAQGGSVEETIKAGRDSRNQGMIINSSRGIIYASSGSDFATAARRETEKLNGKIRKYL